MKIEKKKSEEILLLTIQGRIQMEETIELRSEFQSCLESGAKKILIDLSGITDISSSGVGALLSLHYDLDRDLRKLALSSLSPVCVYVFDILRLMDFFTIYETTSEAMTALRTL